MPPTSYDIHTKLDGPDAGIFTLKGPDLKYVYPRAMHIHYLLTGDERALACGKLMAAYCFNHQDPVYRPGSINPVPLGVDPEKGRNFWTLRHQGYGLLGILHGWEMTGDANIGPRPVNVWMLITNISNNLRMDVHPTDHCGKTGSSTIQMKRHFRVQLPHG